MSTWKEAAEVFKAAVAYTNKELGPILGRLKALEDRAPVPGPPGEKGLNGKDGKDGKDGLPGGKGLDGREGKDGKDGPPGEKGLDGKDGKDGKDGLPGGKGLDGKDGAQGIQGQKGDKGDDGKSVSIDDVRSLFEGEVAKWALNFERRAQDTLQKAVDRIPAPVHGKDGLNGKDGKDGAEGKNGMDGLGFDDLEVVQTGERGLIFRFAKDGKTKEFPLSFPVLIERGIYKPDSRYEKGDGVTYGGSFWICQKDNPETKPGDGPDWRLAVKRGRDAKSET